MTKFEKKLKLVYMKMYLSYLDGTGCKLTITDIETLNSHLGKEWEQLFNRHENDKMKELM